jgi:hypothetical protein
MTVAENASAQGKSSVDMGASPFFHLLFHPSLPPIGHHHPYSGCPFSFSVSCHMPIIYTFADTQKGAFPIF